MFYYSPILFRTSIHAYAAKLSFSHYPLTLTIKIFQQQSLNLLFAQPHVPITVTFPPRQWRNPSESFDTREIQKLEPRSLISLNLQPFLLLSSFSHTYITHIRSARANNRRPAICLLHAHARVGRVRCVCSRRGTPDGGMVSQCARERWTVRGKESARKRRACSEGKRVGEDWRVIGWMVVFKYRLCCLQSL